MTKPTPAQLTEAIKALAAKWIAEGEAPSAYEINNGLCEDFAQAVIGQFGGETDGLSMYWGDELSADGEGYEWDVELLSEHYPASKPTHGLDWADIRGDIPNHAWIILDGRHYDAECPEGVDNLFELPLVRRGMEYFAARKAPAP
jgi:hypothetical protein